MILFLLELVFILVLVLSIAWLISIWMIKDLNMNPPESTLGKLWVFGPTYVWEFLMENLTFIKRHVS